MKIDRRAFIKSVASLIAFPSSFLVIPAPKLIWSVTKGEWGNSINVSKGPHQVSFNLSLSDLRDCHGLCATVEMVCMTVTELTYGRDNIKKIWNMPWESKERAQAWKDLKKVKITEEEVSEIYNVMRELRGPHDCVTTPATISSTGFKWLNKNS